MKNLSYVRHSMKMIGGALISAALASHVRVVSAEEVQNDPQALARQLLDPEARVSPVEARTSRSEGHVDPQHLAQCMIIAAGCEILRGNGASAGLTDVSASPARDRRIDAAALARRLILGERA
jgi:hypothetical protein